MSVRRFFRDMSSKCREDTSSKQNMIALVSDYVAGLTVTPLQLCYCGSVLIHDCFIFPILFSISKAKHPNF